MALEKFQHAGKHDNPNHHGWRANRQRVEAAMEQESLAEQVLFSLACFKQLERLPKEMADYHFALLHGLGLLEKVES